YCRRQAKPPQGLCQSALGENSFLTPNMGITEFRVFGPDGPVTAAVGEDIVLSCHLSPRMSAEKMEVRWFRDTVTSYVHLYEYGKDQFDQQMPDYHGRTELLKAGISDGDVPLRIVNIRLSDEGQYRCLVQDGTFHEEAVLELKVAASGSAPHIFVEGHQDGGIRVVCQSGRWYPKPEVLWRGLSGQPLSFANETKSEEEHGFFEINNSIIIMENSNQNLSCSLRNTYLNQEKESITFYISGQLPSKLQSLILNRKKKKSDFNLIKAHCGNNSEPTPVLSPLRPLVNPPPVAKYQSVSKIG
uniref:Ig-like domain-containing protein n=1 Tax=Pelusios castaneus TaxID=367368 RepID=A0A8C8REI5_9SAUR